MERVKALLGSKGKKLRKAEGIFISDGYQAIKSALNPGYAEAPVVEKIYATEKGIEKLTAEFTNGELSHFDLIAVSDQVMDAMADAETPQGVLSLCSTSSYTFQKLRASIGERESIRVAYFWQMQDPGNAGTVIRSADAFGCDAVLFSPDSVDIYSPKTIRASVGSIWNLPVIEDVHLSELRIMAGKHDIPIYAFDADGEQSLLETSSNSFITLFGNEARGLPEFSADTSAELSPSQSGDEGEGRVAPVAMVSIPMLGKTESLNVASAATIALFHLSIGRL